MRVGLYPRGICSGSHDLCKFWEVNNDILETVKDRHIVAIENRMWPIEWYRYG